MIPLSAKKRGEVLDALRRGTVPSDGLDVLAVGLDRFSDSMDLEIAKISEGGSGFKAVRGDYGCGKTFFSRWLQERARSHNLATTEVQISETETPLHRLETVYRRMTERLTTSSSRSGALEVSWIVGFMHWRKTSSVQGRWTPTMPKRF